MLVSTCRSKYCKCDGSLLELVWKNQAIVTTMAAGIYVVNSLSGWIFAFSSGVLLCSLSSLGSLFVSLLRIEHHVGKETLDAMQRVLTEGWPAESEEVD